MGSTSEVSTFGGSPSLRLEPGRGGERIGYEQAGFLETTQTQFATALNSLRRPFQSLIPTSQADHLTITWCDGARALQQGVEA